MYGAGGKGGGNGGGGGGRGDGRLFPLPMPRGWPPRVALFSQGSHRMGEKSGRHAGMAYSILRAHAIEGKPLPRPLHNYYLYHCIAYVQCSGARSAQASELRLHRSDLSHRCRTPLESKLRVPATPPLLRRRTWSGGYLGLGFGSRFG